MKKVIIYTQETCPPCKMEKIWLKANDIEFEERDVRKNRTYLQELAGYGASGTPLTVIKNDSHQEKLIYGYNQRELEKELLY